MYDLMFRPFHDPAGPENRTLFFPPLEDVGNARRCATFCGIFGAPPLVGCGDSAWRGGPPTIESIVKRRPKSLGKRNKLLKRHDEWTPSPDGIQRMSEPETTRGSRAKLNVSQWVDEHADVLFRYALQRIRRRDVAEELVQETFLAALRAHGEFGGQSSERTWLVGILRHKIVDHIRRAAQARSSRPDEGEDVSMDKFFKKNGHWKNEPHDWGSDPVEVLDKRDFWQVLEECFSALPQGLADTFVLRELEERQPAEVCETLEISESNLWVRLHRARLLLKECLEKNWFKIRSK
jgi:RNA polymerase sigma-70 factor (ECF subfamily)